MIGRTISHYRILAKLGEGGMGVVYRAEDLRLKRTVALKFLPREETRDPEAKARFVREAEAASALDHPGICTVHAIEETEDGQLFIAMACYEGETLRQRIARGPLPVAEALDVARQVAQGLARAHERGIVHRDIKPANLFLTSDGLVKILDFGLAKLARETRLTRTGTTLGTVAYMSPEQARGGDVDPATDVWSLGAVLHEMLAGEPPFRGDRNEAVIYSILSLDPPPLSELRPGLPPRLEELVERCLEKEPQRRHAGAAELLAAIEVLVGELALGIRSRRSLSLRRLARRRRGRLAAVAAAVVAAAALALRLFTAAPPGVAAIAVLPMTNLSGDPDQDYLADGMTDALINELAHIGALRVISRTSVMQYRANPRPLPEIARELGVDAVVEASVLRLGDRVRVTAQLIDADSDRGLWADRYDRDLSDVLGLYSDVARAIAAAIEVTVTPAEQTMLAPRHPVDPAAYEAYLRGRVYADKWSDEDFAQALAHLRRAVTLDPEFVPAIAELVSVYADAHAASHLSHAEAYPPAARALARALELAPHRPEVQVAQGMFRYKLEWDWPGADAAFRRAIALAPGNADAHCEYGAFLTFMGQADESIAELRRGVELAPLSIWFNQNLGWALHLAGRYDEAIAQFERTRDLLRQFPDPLKMHQTARQIMWSLICAGRFPEAFARLEELGDRVGPTDYDRLWLYVRSGRREEIVGTIDSLLAPPPPGEPAPGPCAVSPWILGVLGETDRVLRCLESRYANHSFHVVFASIIHEYDGLRADPRFQDLMRRLDLPWRG